MFSYATLVQNKIQKKDIFSLILIGIVSIFPTVFMMVVSGALHFHTWFLTLPAHLHDGGTEVHLMLYKGPLQMLNYWVLI